jgi:hypothetical protein
MRTSQKTPETITTIGIDLGKNTFHLVGLDKRGAIVLQQKVSRGQLGRHAAEGAPPSHLIKSLERVVVGKQEIDQRFPLVAEHEHHVAARPQRGDAGSASKRRPSCR